MRHATMRLDQSMIKHQIESLKVQFPDVFDDEESWLIALETETDLIKCLDIIESRRQDAIALAETIDSLIENHKARRSRFRARDEAARSLILNLMQSAGLKKLELPQSTLSVRDGIQKVVIVDEAEIPNEFFRIKREPDKIAIKNALNDGESVPGAAMSNVEPILAIRTR